MGIGAIGSAVGSVAGAVGRAAGGVGRGISGFRGGGLEARGGGGGPTGPALVSGLARFDQSPTFRVGPAGVAPRGFGEFGILGRLGPLKAPINEGPVPLLGGFRNLGAKDMAPPDLGGVFRPAFGLVNEGPLASLAGLRTLGRRDLAIPDVGGKAVKLNRIQPAKGLDLPGLRLLGRNDLAAPEVGGIFKPAAELRYTRPAKGFNPKGEIAFNPKPKLNIEASLKEADVLAGVEAVLSKAKPKVLEPAGAVMPKVEPVVLLKVKPRVKSIAVPAGLEQPKPEAVVSPALQPAVKAGPQTATETTNEVKQSTLIQPALEEQEATEVVTERSIAKQMDTVNEEKYIREKKFVVDKPTLAHRLQEVRRAVRQAKLEAEKLGKKLTGGLVVKFLSLSHQGDISQIVRPEGPDGTIPLTQEEIRAKGELGSEEEAETAVLNNIPVSKEEDGERVSDEQVRKVHQDLLVKPGNSDGPVNIRERRITQKKQKPSGQRPELALVSKQPEAKKENTIQGLGLAEVFQQKVA